MPAVALADIACVLIHDSSETQALQGLPQFARQVYDLFDIALQRNHRHFHRREVLWQFQ